MAPNISLNFHLCSFLRALQYYHGFQMLIYDSKTNQVHD